MRKEWLLVTALMVNSCKPIVAQVMEPEVDESKSKISDYTPTPTETPTTISTPYLLPNIPLSENISTPTPTEIPVANSCMLPFEGASINGNALAFVSPILTESGKQDKDKFGRPLWHLGLDFTGNSEQGGETVVNMCDGTLIFSGPVRNTPQTTESAKNLGNVVVMKYRYLNTQTNNMEYVFMVYAHLENTTNLAPGTVIKKGEQIGLLGRSGGWRNAHLHVHIWTEEAWNIAATRQDINGNLQKLAGFYPDGEYGEGLARQSFIDPKEWLLERLLN